MKLRAAACLALALMAGAPAIAQDAKPKPDTAPGVQVERVSKLMVGDRAPELAISEWVKGEPITGFEAGKVYIVEFWATWCGPCIAGMPHLSEVQKEYKDKGVTVIGVTSVDSRGNSLEEVKKMVAAKGDTMGYTVAWDTERETNEAFMRAADQRFIPASFIVDQNGYVAWIGHPMELDEPLAEIVAGEWDLNAAAEEHAVAVRAAAEEAKQMEARTKLLNPIGQALQANEYATAYSAIENAMGDPVLWDSAQTLNQVAWPLVDPDVEIQNRNTALPVKLAERACKLTEYKDPMILDTLAWAYYHAGDKAKAIEIETKAISLLPADQRADYEKALERMKK